MSAHAANATTPIAETCAVTVDVATEFDGLFQPGGQWDQLLARSASTMLFVTSGWLRAWRATLGVDAALVVVQIRRHGTLIAAAAFQHRDGVVEFAGKGPSDYADFVVANNCTASEENAALLQMLAAAMRATPGFRHFMLGRFPPTSESVARLRRLRGPLYATVAEAVPCPRMTMSAVGAALRKKSLRRIARVLERHGALVCDTYSRAIDVHPLLDSFFEQHVRRWAATDTPSLFLDSDKRAFYRAVVSELDGSGELRFSVLRLDGRVIATHFGFLCGSDFVLYKPTYEPDVAELSPGLALLLRLFERARDEGAAVFDFTIGAEAYKARFASDVPNAHMVHVTNSWLAASLRRVRVRGRQQLASIVGRVAVQRLCRLLRRSGLNR